MKRAVFIALSILVIAVACKKDKPENPYAQNTDNSSSVPDFGAVPSDNFAYLHEKVFSPTCANSGCHDGTFEPEFRSITSSYNSLVNHGVISNDELNSYEKRVVPGNHTQSLLYARLTEFLPNTSGMMPLEVDENSDWESQSENYITQIRNWINNGAPDMFGNLPGDGSLDLPPSANGLVVFPSGQTSNPYERDPESTAITPILVDASSVDIWVLLEDDNTNTQTLALADLAWAPSLAELDNVTSTSLSTASQIQALDFSENNSTFYHSASIDLSSYESGNVIYLRLILNDGVQTANTEIPNENSSAVITSIFTLQIL